MELPALEELRVTALGPAGHPSPLREMRERFVTDDERVLASAETRMLEGLRASGTELPSFEMAGPRDAIHFEPSETTCGLVTCGGLCPGINDVIRSVVLTLTHGYGVRRIIGFKYGFAGVAGVTPHAPVFLDAKTVTGIHQQGGTLLGTSRGSQDVRLMVDNLVKWDVRILFVIGGDGTLRGAHAIHEEIARRNLLISVIGIPKTIDNDLLWTERTFGFVTAVDEAQAALMSAHAEAVSVRNGVGLVKLMGRYSGSIAASATLANGDVNFCLVPEVPFTLEGEGGFLDLLEERLIKRHHALVVVAEGAGQDLMPLNGEDEERDASGNVKLRDVGPFLRDRIREYCDSRRRLVDVKYIDPSYTIRSQTANSYDSSFCLILGQHAVHAGMAGRTDMMVGYWNNHFTHVPLPVVVKAGKKLDPDGELWQRVLGATGQPPSMVGRTA